MVISISFTVINHHDDQSNLGSHNLQGKLINLHSRCFYKIHCNRINLNAMLGRLRILAGSFSRVVRPLVNNVASTLPYKLAPKVPNPYSMTITRTMANHRHKKMIKLAKGYRGRANRCFRVAKQRVMKARQYAYRDRKVHIMILLKLRTMITTDTLQIQVKKREFRKLWIQRVNAGSRMYGLSYSQFIHGMYLSNLKLNRKVLSEMAITEPLSFRSVAELSRQAINTKYEGVVSKKLRIKAKDEEEWAAIRQGALEEHERASRPPTR